MRIRATHLAGAVVASASLGLGAVAIGSGAGAHGRQVRATLHAVDGTKVGRVTFSNDRQHTQVIVHFDSAPGADAFHGFHIHANNDPANGVGCDASGNFASADGHWKQLADETHGHHAGDMPSVYVNPDGSVDSRFTLDRIALADLRGKVVIFHAGADNFGNVPVGSLVDQYSANSQAALDATAATGNAGARVACGVIK